MERYRGIMNNDINMDELAEVVAKIQSKKKREKEKRRMKTGKKALYSAYVICIALIAFTMIMIALGKDTTSLTVLATAGVGVLPVFYGIYDYHNTKINLKHMDENYISNYDEQEGIY